MLRFFPTSNKLTMGTIWQAKAIIGLAKQILSQGNSPQARIALAAGIRECASAIETHEGAYGTKDVETQADNHQHQPREGA